MARPKNKKLLDPDGINKKRAASAQYAIDAFADQTSTADEDALKDLLCNLMHWCDQHGQDFDAALDAGRRHHKSETTESN